MSIENVKEGLELPEQKYDLPVDTEKKATKIKIHSFAMPHMRAFHLSWLAFFSTFVSTFGPAALLTIVREDLNMTRTDIGNAGIAAVCGAVFGRVALGNFCDTFGPRYAVALVTLCTAPAVFSMAMVTNGIGFLLCRFFIGFSLCTFVGCQFWCSSMFNTKIVGTANAIAAGWGNMGGGATHFIMPNLYVTIMKGGVTSFMAWRWAFFVPGAMHLVCGIATMLFSTDLPDGNYKTLVKSGDLVKPKGSASVMCAIKNYRTWILMLNYGYCFGVELTLDNIVTQYLADQFALDVKTAGDLGAVFGMLNLFTRATGGMISDVAGKYFGMRGRIWALWAIQTAGGVFCALIGRVDYSLALTMVIKCLFGIACQQACGLSIGVAPFVSKRATGQVLGFVGAGGNIGGAVTQALFFAGNFGGMSTQDGMTYMGYMIIAVTATLAFVYFPMWGGMLLPPKKGITEEDYYLAEYTAEEKAQGLHSASLKFAFESRSERAGGWAKNKDDIDAEDANKQVTGVPKAVV